MADLKQAEITYPSPPPAQIAKPVFLPGEKPSEPDKFSLWGSHDPALFRDPVSGLYYTYCTGATARRSADLITWENIGKVVEKPPQESLDWVGDEGIWAPDIIKVGDEYRLYCSNSTWGVRQSNIFLAVADGPEGPFIPRGVVLKTSHDSTVNAIDANLIADETTGEHYMAYGSFWGGMHILKLNPETGLAAEEGIGTCIARRPQWADGAIEGPYIRFNPDTGFYYLFVSYGSLKSDYNIRVGRSTSLTGPYYDPNGRDLTDPEDDRNEIGFMIACGYRFGDGQGYMGPGHNSVLRDADNEWYLACHIREHDFRTPQISTMHIYKMFWTPDGWPVLNPERYAGEKTQPIAKDSLSGDYERIKLAPSVPQGVLNSVPMTLAADGKFECCSIIGQWEAIDETRIVIRYGNVIETLQLTPAWDWQRGEPTLAMTGKDQFGVAVWAKKLNS
ncbi:arabinan endo-1,5-alpha-L-arabinosidase [Paenibacillus phyllosphaerae]|uniref:Arabinan endo-1,5-alpha-L-arabinosidase n=1 Tax=Paenibacillus phyllosphaerae TaxID=274593 RepID=A0A7W5B3Y6_9BACL|nr:arabinan endo-1,5-alpha-L-arabinosidase [Paenibacillus phyllosphaerae]MBB3113970.1 arabinan endo-1,5-alpha-L-arabinosidase [Paenibacillus phyllosphaerae]